MQIVAEIEKHALEVFPNECVGFVLDGEYHRLENVSHHPTLRYQLSTKDKMKLFALGKRLEALVHSHPVLDNTPSEVDILAHKTCKFDFWIIGTDGRSTTELRKLII